jgi:hypothetical protein
LLEMVTEHNKTVDVTAVVLRLIHKD